MTSSLGHDVVTACAAFRAGLALPRGLDNFRLHSTTDTKAEAVICHTAREVTDGFEGRARLLRLLQSGLTDLQRQSRDGPWLSTRAEFFLSMPDPRRVSRGLARAHDKEARPAEPEEIEAEEPDEAEAADLFRNAARASAWPVDPAVKFVTTSGHTGVAEAVARALVELRKGRIGAAIVGGVDSLLDEDTLWWLYVTGRLRITGAPVGLRPGEACGFLVLETRSAATSRGAAILARIDDVHEARESDTLLSGAPALGKGLAKVLAQAHAGDRLDRAWVITDLNGEIYRATEWGNAIARASMGASSFQSLTTWHPAVSFGDTGAASGVVSLCALIEAFRRGYAPADVGIVSSSSDGSLRTAIRVNSY